MKIALLAVLVVVAIGAAAVILTKHRRPSRAGGQNAGAALRQMFLTMAPADAAATPPETTHGVWATAMDLSFDNGSATIISTIEGAASLYTSTGGGVIGGEAHERVRTAAVRFVQAVESCASQMSTGPIQSLPAPGHVRFYAHSRAGLLHSAEVTERELEGGTSPLAPCYVAAQDVITELRLSGPDA